MKKTATDVTDLSDAAFDVFLAVKAGEDCVDAGHLTASERLAVCDALGLDLGARAWWLHSGSTDNPHDAPLKIHPSRRSA
jgi:hypothetical protein